MSQQHRPQPFSKPAVTTATAPAAVVDRVGDSGNEPVPPIEPHKTGGLYDIDPKQPVKFEVVNNPNAKPASEVDCDPNWAYRWTSKSNVGQMYDKGYDFVKDSMMVDHNRPLGTHEFRYWGFWQADVAGRVYNSEGLFLMATPRTMRENRQRSLARESQRIMEQSNNVPIGTDQPWLRNPRTHDQLKQGTYLERDTI